nr:hypothetical protein JOCKYQNQ_JOCKYQNQ_CDS_0002 [Autographiviridae sp.]
MADINWSEVLAIAQLLIAIGALGGKLPICWYILVAEMSIAMYVGVPGVAIWWAYVTFGETGAIVVFILAIAFVAYYFYSGRQIEKKFKDISGK